MLTKMQNVFGLLLLRSGERLKRLGERLGTKDTGKVPTKTPLKIWGIMEGPFHRDDFPEDELDDLGISDDVEWMIVAKIEEDGKIGTVNFWYETFEEVDALVGYFKFNIEPLEVIE